jgi:hypothetical protein
VGTDLRIVQRGVLVEVHSLDIREERRKRGRVLRASRRTSTPYSNSALVTTDIQTSLIGTD